MGRRWPITSILYYADGIPTPRASTSAANLHSAYAYKFTDENWKARGQLRRLDISYLTILFRLWCLLSTLNPRVIGTVV